MIDRFFELYVTKIFTEAINKNEGPEESISIPTPTQSRLLDPTKEKERQRSSAVNRAMEHFGPK